MVKKFLLASLLALMCLGGGSAAAKTKMRSWGLQLGMTEESARHRLKKVATQQKEEREEEEGGEQEVWILKKDAKYNYLIARFNKEHRLILLTVVARPQRVRYADLASLDTAAKASDGQNYSYKWKIEPGKGARAYIINARGSSSEFLTSYSVYYLR